MRESADDLDTISEGTSVRPHFDQRKNVRAWCDRCAAITTFEKGRGGSNEHGHCGPLHTDGLFRISRLYSCSGCGRGGLGELGSPSYDVETHMELLHFYPTSFARQVLPAEAPEGVRREIEEAAACADAGAFRGGSALLRSALEKTLVANGYGTGNLVKKIELAAGDGVITSARRQRAHTHVRALGNDVVHDEWRPVDAEEFELAYQYVQRIVEDFYEHREEVVTILIDKGRLTADDDSPEERAAEDS